MKKLLIIVLATSRATTAPASFVTIAVGARLKRNSAPSSAAVASGRNTSQVAFAEGVMKQSSVKQKSSVLTMASCQRFGSADVQLIRLLPA